MREDLEGQGKWLFRRRSFVPLLLVIVVIGGLSQYPRSINHGWDQAWEIICLGISLSGLIVRMMTIGFIPKGTSGRSTTTMDASTLNTLGMYSIVRNPLYLGNALMWFGLSMLLRQWSVTVVFMLLFWLYYERIIYAEEAFLREKFGLPFLAWAQKTPAFFPRLGNWRSSGQCFSIRRVLRREYSPFFAIIAAFTFMEIITDWAAYGKPEIDYLWLSFFGGGALIYVTLRTLKKKTKILDAEPVHIGGSGGLRRGLQSSDRATQSEL